MNKRPLVVANWKMYVQTPQEAKKFAAALRRRARSFPWVEVVLAPGFTLIPAVAEALRGSAIKVGAQTLSSWAEQQHTGEVSAAMLKQAGVSQVLVGHSERRASGEGQEQTNAALLLAHAAGLTAILCVGELERDPGGAHFSIIERQLSSALKQVSKTSVARLVVAYEPVWAIGKSAQEAMRPADVREMSIFIRKTLAGLLGRATALRVPILYGGSVEGENARQLLVEGGVSGFLVGRASASIDSFLEILKQCK